MIVSYVTERYRNMWIPQIVYKKGCHFQKNKSVFPITQGERDGGTIFFDVYPPIKLPLFSKVLLKSEDYGDK